MDWFEIVALEASGEAVFSGFTLKWLSAFKMDKMVTRGRLSIHLQEAPKLSKEWGEVQSGKDDLIGIWPSQSGVWMKYSQTGNWAKLSSTARHIAAGLMRGGAGAAEVLAEPFGGFAESPGDFGYQELSEAGPGGLHFLCREEENLIPWKTGSLLCGECLVPANTVSNALNRKTWPQARESKRNAKLRNIGNRSKKYGVL